MQFSSCKLQKTNEKYDYLYTRKNPSSDLYEMRGLIYSLIRKSRFYCNYLAKAIQKFIIITQANLPLRQLFKPIAPLPQSPDLS